MPHQIHGQPKGAGRIRFLIVDKPVVQRTSPQDVSLQCNRHGHGLPLIHESTLRHNNH
jgi:hypothetical protein